MTLKEIMQQDLGSIADDMENPTFEWNGEDYECIPSSTNVDEALGIGGFNINFARTLTVNKELFTDELFPKEKDRITFEDQEYRIERRINNGNNAFIRLICIDPTHSM